MNVYPIFLNDLTGRRCVVIGGDHEAERKADELVACGASVVLVAPEVTQRIEEWDAEGRLTWHRRDYREGDLKDAFLAIVSETNPARTAPIYKEAMAEKVLFNAMDDVDHCTFVAGSVVRRDQLVVAISTSGAAPALSVRMRQDMEARYGPEYATFLRLLKSLRAPMAATYPEFKTRKRLWYEIVDGDVLDLLASGNYEEAVARIEAITGLRPTATLPEATPAEAEILAS